MDIFKVLVEKLSQYNFLTNILPGTVLCILMKYLVGYDIIPSEYYQAGIVFYFVGMLNGRIGSLIVEPFLKYIKWVVFAPYPDYVLADQNDKKVSILNQENNVYRSYITVTFITLSAFLYKNYLVIFEFIKDNEKILLLIFMFLIFLCSYRKQTGYVKQRVETNIKKLKNHQEKTNE